MLRAMLFGLVGLVSLISVGCASDDEALAEKDRLIQEKAQENEGLQRQNADLKSTSLVMQRELDEKNRQLSAPPVQQPSGGTALEKPAQKEPSNAGAKDPKEPAAKHSASKVAIKDEDVDVSTRSDGATVVRIAGSATFAPGSATLTKRGQDALKKIASELKSEHGEIRIEGHTDSTPLTGKNKETYGTNQHLSIARALAVQEYLVNTCKMPKSRISEVVGLGDTKPLDKANTKAAHAKNRRIDIIVNPK